MARTGLMDSARRSIWSRNARLRRIEIRKATGKLRQGQTEGGQFAASGNFDRSKLTGQVALKLDWVYRKGFGTSPRPVAWRKEIGLDFAQHHRKRRDRRQRRCDGQGRSPRGQSRRPRSEPATAATPLEARVQTDLTASNKVATIRQLVDPDTHPASQERSATERHGGLQQGHRDHGNLKIAAESLDATAYYDIFTGGQKTSSRPVPASRRDQPRRPPQRHQPLQHRPPNRRQSTYRSKISRATWPLASFICARSRSPICKPRRRSMAATSSSNRANSR